MWKIKKAKHAGLTKPSLEAAKPQSDAVPRYLSRQLLALLRMTSFAVDEMERVFQALPPAQRPVYEHLSCIKFCPSLTDIISLIDQSERLGLLTSDEAASIRAAKVRDFQNPLPDDDVREFC